MTWSIKDAITQGDEATITLVQTTQDETGEDKEETRVVHHFRSSFPGGRGGEVTQTLVQWRANIKREVEALLTHMNADKPTTVDIVSHLR
ncbi:hypothetical protein CMI37_34845 [Candidatus Pacearchaeota archaeon]|nr:hypothetical protein [Candidatus Pacearchaeota archaeon]